MLESVKALILVEAKCGMQNGKVNFRTPTYLLMLKCWILLVGVEFYVVRQISIYDGGYDAGKVRSTFMQAKMIQVQHANFTYLRFF